MPDKYRFKLAYVGFTPIMNDNIHVPAPFDNISFQLLDYLDRFIPMGFPEFVEPYDSIVWSAEGMPKKSVNQIRGQELDGNLLFVLAPVLESTSP